MQDNNQDFWIEDQSLSLKQPIEIGRGFIYDGINIDPDTCLIRMSTRGRTDREGDNCNSVLFLELYFHITKLYFHGFISTLNPDRGWLQIVLRAGCVGAWRESIRSSVSPSLFQRVSQQVAK